MNESIETLRAVSHLFGFITAEKLSRMTLQALPGIERLGVDRSSLGMRLREASQVLEASGRAMLIQELDNFSALSRPDWDEEGALPISGNTISEAVDFVEKIPPNLPMPEATPDPRGRIGLEWHVDGHELLVVTFGGTGSIAFTAMFGRDDYLSGLTPCSQSGRIFELLDQLRSHRDPQ